MFDFHEKRKIRSLLYSKFSIGIVLLLFIGLSISTYERFSVERKMLERRNEAQSELSELKERAATLEAQVNHFENERGVEEELRSRFDVAKEGEQVIIIVGDEEVESTDLHALSKPPGDESETRSLFEILKFW